MKIKICGITTLEDALAAVEAGADLLGFNFYPPSPRYITPQACAQIVRRTARHRGVLARWACSSTRLPAKMRDILDELRPGPGAAVRR